MSDIVIDLMLCTSEKNLIVLVIIQVLIAVKRFSIFLK